MTLDGTSVISNGPGDIVASLCPTLPGVGPFSSEAFSHTFSPATELSLPMLVEEKKASSWETRYSYKALKPSVPTPAPVGPTSRKRATTHEHSLVLHAAC